MRRLMRKHNVPRKEAKRIANIYKESILVQYGSIRGILRLVKWSSEIESSKETIPNRKNSIKNISKSQTHMI